jgi:hypothetical protein
MLPDPRSKVLNIGPERTLADIASYVKLKVSYCFGLSTGASGMPTSIPARANERVEPTLSGKQAGGDDPSRTTGSVVVVET